MSITVTKDEKCMELQEYMDQKKAERVLERKSIRWVLFAVKVMQNNFSRGCYK
jgi:hypothetical protein